ncbi:MAG: DUF3243 family protein [Firmicutes bacterium]|nr:DUF3243 family protein [Bacillota bacterium]
MSTTDVTPRSLQDVWDWAAARFDAHDATHMDAVLMQIGDRVAAHPPTDLSEDDLLALEAWQSGSPNERHRLAHLFMRTVGHQEFLGK